MELVRGPAQPAAAPSRLRASRSATTTACTAVTSTCSPRCARRARARRCRRRCVTFEPTPREYFRGRRGAGAPDAPAREARGARAVRRRPRRVLRFDEEHAPMPARQRSIERLLRRRARRRATSSSVTISTSRASARARSRRCARPGVAHGFDGRGGRAVRARRRARQQFARARGARSRRPRSRGAAARPAVPDDRPRAARAAGSAARSGFPTANLRAAPQGRRRSWGIFAVRVHGGGLADHPAVASLGTRPTVDGTDPLLEVHLFDFDGDLYGQIPAASISSRGCATSASLRVARRAGRADARSMPRRPVPRSVCMPPARAGSRRNRPLGWRNKALSCKISGSVPALRD